MTDVGWVMIMLFLWVVFGTRSFSKLLGHISFWIEFGREEARIIAIRRQTRG